MKREHVLVTGGAGYIGSHIVRDLGENQYLPVVVDNLSTGKQENILSGEFIEGDVGDSDLIKKIIRQYDIQSVIHFAAFIEVNESVRDPLKYYINNSVNAMKLIDTCQKNGVKNFVFSSTAATYGIPKEIPVPETAPLAPINPYGSSKVVTEMILKDLSVAKKDFNYVALRYFNVAGADQQARIGQDYPNPTHLITMALKAASRQFPKLSVFGTDYPTPDGTAIRDYIHVDDLATAHILALRFLQDRKESQVFNCGYERGSSVLEVIKSVKDVTGVDFPVEMTGRREGDPPSLVANSQKIRKYLGWEPKYDSLENIVSTAWKWEQKLQSR